MKINQISMTTDSDIDSKKVIDAAVDNNVDRIIELDPSMTYVRSYIDNMDIVDESFTMLNEAADVPKEFVNFAYDLFNDLRDDFERPVRRSKFPFGTQKNDIKKSKPKVQYIFNLKGFKAQKIDTAEIKSNIAKKYGMIKLYDASIFDKGSDIIYGKLSSDKKYIIALTKVGIIVHNDVANTYNSNGSMSTTVIKNDNDINATLQVIITCYKIDKKILKKIDKSDYKSAKTYLKDNLSDKDKTEYEKYLEGSFGKSPIIDYTNINEHQDIKDRVHNNEYLKIVHEYCDLSNPEFKKKLIYVNEAEQNKVLMSLTSKLYATIVDKANEIDFEDIPESKGDITKLKNYDLIIETVSTIKSIIKEFKQDTNSINVISEAIANVETRKDEFTKAFRLGYEIPKLLYVTTVMAIVDSISYMIATCIEFIKTPKNESFDMVLDVMRYKKVKENLVFTNLDKLNKEFKNGNIDKVLKEISKGAVERPVNEIAVPILIGLITIASAVGVTVILIILKLLGIMQNLITYHYNKKQEKSENYELMALMLEANANNLKSNHPDWDDSKIKDVYERQMKAVEKWRKKAEKLRIISKKSEIDTEKELKNIKKLDSDSFEDASKYDSSLF